MFNTFITSTDTSSIKIEHTIPPEKQTNLVQQKTSENTEQKKNYYNIDNEKANRGSMLKISLSSSSSSSVSSSSSTSPVSSTSPSLYSTPFSNKNQAIQQQLDLQQQQTYSNSQFYNRYDQVSNQSTMSGYQHLAENSKTNYDLQHGNQFQNENFAQNSLETFHSDSVLTNNISPKYHNHHQNASSYSNCYQISNPTSNNENSNDFYRVDSATAALSAATAAAAIAAAACNANNTSQCKNNYNTGAFLRYMRPASLKPENICSWIDPETKKMCNRVFYRMDEIGKILKKKRKN